MHFIVYAEQKDNDTLVIPPLGLRRESFGANVISLVSIIPFINVLLGICHQFWIHCLLAKNRKHIAYNDHGILSMNIDKGYEEHIRYKDHGKDHGILRICI